MTQYAMAVEPQPISSPTPKPQAIQIAPKIDRPGYVFTQGAINSIANQKKSLETCKLDLDTTQKAFEKCNAQTAPPLAFWQHADSVIAMVVGSLVGGVIVGYAVSKASN
jgi:uncharacterized membrane-anchored protein YhcB (DUF1043 family)